MKLKLSEGEVFIKYFDWVKYFAEVSDYFLLYWMFLRFFLKFSLSSFCYISNNSLNKSISIEVKIMIPFGTYSTMDDVLIEMEAIREFVVESLAEFRSELSAMNLKIQSADKKTDELDNSYKDFCEKYSGLEERIENIFQSSRNSSTDSGKRKYISDDEEEEEDEEEDETSIPSTLDDISPQVKENLKKIYNNLSYMKDKEKVTKVQLTFIHYWLLQKDSNCPSKFFFLKESKSFSFQILIFMLWQNKSYQLHVRFT